ncbi:MAG: HAMP domain-containing histidine kinase [Candidatus Wildermuthbacteria bacterium]|nr:HAMP domain-containing histidine kinase [Candidatus Wildermuthbacteria bacterium]
MLDLKLVIAIIALGAISNLGLAIIVLIRSETKTTNFWFGLAAIFSALLGIANILFRLTQDTIFVPITYAFGIFIVIHGLIWAISFTNFLKSRRIYILFLEILGFILASLPFLPQGFLDNIRRISPVVYKGEPGIFFFIYVLAEIFLLILILFVLLKAYLGANTLLKIQLRFVVIGILLYGIIASIVGVIAPAFGYTEYAFFDSPASLIWIALSTYAIIKHQLFNVRVVATELLVGIVSIVLLIDAITSDSLLQILLKLLIFFIFIYLGIGLIRSVLNEIRQKEELAKTYAKLKQLDEAKSEFISIVSHQLRTPLTAMKGYLSMLVEGTYGKSTPKTQKVLENVFNSNERLINLVNDILNISRIEAGKIHIEITDIDLDALAKSLFEELRIKADEKKIKLIFENKSQKPIKFQGDEEKIRNAILNIVDNAIRYTPTGTIAVKAEMIPQDSNPKIVRISITDTGEGMSKEELQRLFQSFSRGVAGMKSWTEGAGLGLYIAKQFVRLHHGSIWAESSGKGEGSTFFIELPIESPIKNSTPEKMEEALKAL